MDQAELDERARKCMEAAFHAVQCADGDKTFGEIRDALRTIYGREVFERAKEMAAPAPRNADLECGGH